MVFGPTANYSIDVDKVRGANIKCGTECLFKYNFQEQSTSFKSCLSFTDTPGNTLKMPYINITNEFLSNTANTGTIAVNFQNDNYWFNGAYITKPGNLFMNFKMNSVYEPDVLAQDPSACSLLIVCYNGNNSYLTIVQNIVPRQSVMSNSRGTVLTNIINDIDRILNVNDISFNSKLCGDGGSSLPISTVNFNNLIPSDDNFFFYGQQSASIYYNYIIFSPIKPILITNSVEKILEAFFKSSSGSSTSTTITPPTYIALPGTSNTTRVYTSSQPPINNLSEGEDDIYIKCQPTDQEGNILVSGQSVAPQLEQFNLNSILDGNNNLFTSAILGIFIMIVIIKGGELILKNGTRTLLGGD